MAVTSTLGAQWPSYPTPGVPRTADGKPNLEAPTPRTADGKVDFSGIWMRAGGGGGGRGRGDGAPPPPATTPDGTPLSTFGEVAGRGYPLPMTPWAAELKKKRMADNSKDNPDVWCLPIGRHHTSGLSLLLSAMRFFLSSAAHGVIGNGYPRAATSPKVESGVPSGVVVGGGGAPSPRPRPPPRLRHASRFQRNQPCCPRSRRRRFKVRLAVGRARNARRGYEGHCAPSVDHGHENGKHSGNPQSSSNQR